ncbi:protein kinase [Novymonas esmeraldas]|uniref:Protein kinase n=1 Tax=Novymonas esmeraldas TaxID=1808958 RepID=A0AAW0ET22_9TRYP
MASRTYHSSTGVTAVAPHGISISTAAPALAQRTSGHKHQQPQPQQQQSSRHQATSSPTASSPTAANNGSTSSLRPPISSLHFDTSGATAAAAAAGGSSSSSITHDSRGRATTAAAAAAAATTEAPTQMSSRPSQIHHHQQQQQQQQHAVPLSHSTDVVDDDDDGEAEGELLEYCGVRLLPGVAQIDFDEGVYVGTVDENGDMAGYGKATWHSGDVYEGEWLDGAMHGRGTYTWEDGDQYHGSYVRGRMEGSGEMRDATGSYTGEWVEDMRQGYGRMVYVGGNVYEGEWLAGMRHGAGKLVEEAALVTYEGEFNRNEKCGRGVQTNADGDVYDGDFAHGKPNGRGTYLWADGARYMGMFKDGVKHGDGCEWLANGDWIAGRFVNGEHVDDQSTRHKATVLSIDSDEEDTSGNGQASLALSDTAAAAVLAPLDTEKLRRIAEQAQAPSFSSKSVASPGGAATATARATLSTAAGESMRGGAPRQTGTPSHRDARRRTSGAAAAAEAAGAAAAAAAAPSSPFAAALTAPLMFLDDSDLEGWTPLKTIGKGSFGAVYTALLRNGRTVCCKVIELGSVENEEEMEKLRNEIALMKRLRHPNCVQYYGSLEDKTKNTLNIFMEYVSGGTLTSFVTKFKSIPLTTLRQWAYQMVYGVKYLHECGIVHRDIKGDNVLVSVDGIVKLADFGCSKAIDDVCSATHGCATMVGTPYWMAPEVIKCEAGGYGMKSDVWSIGCTMVEMLTGKPPWPECNSMWAAVYKIANSTGLPTEIPADIDPELMDLLRRCFERNPKLRPTAAEMLRHPFLAPVADAAAAVDVGE